jgi:hypothetical protein
VPDVGRCGAGGEGSWMRYSVQESFFEEAYAMRRLTSKKIKNKDEDKKSERFNT